MIVVGVLVRLMALVLLTLSPVALMDPPEVVSDWMVKRVFPSVMGVPVKLAALVTVMLDPEVLSDPLV